VETVLVDGTAVRSNDRPRFYVWMAGVFVLIAFGALAQATRHNPPTDAYGYTEAERQMFVSGCGGGGRCECLFSEIERSIPHEQFIAESRRYNQTGSFSSEFVSRLTAIELSSGC